MTIDRRYSEILRHAHELIQKSPQMSFGEALDQAKKHVGGPVPKHIEDKLLVTLFKLALFGFPSRIDA